MNVSNSILHDLTPQSHIPGTVAFIPNKRLKPLLGINPRTAYNWRTQGLLMAFKSAGKIYYRYSDIEPFLVKKYGNKPESWRNLHARLYTDWTGYEGVSDVDLLDYLREKLFPTYWMFAKDPRSWMFSISMN